MKLVIAAVGGLLLCSLADAQKPESKPDMDKLLDKLTFTKDKASLPYRLLKPDGYDKDGKDRYPLVVFLHGAGGNQARARSMNGSSARAPDACAADVASSSASCASAILSLPSEASRASASTR